MATERYLIGLSIVNNPVEDGTSSIISETTTGLAQDYMLDCVSYTMHHPKVIEKHTLIGKEGPLKNLDRIQENGFKNRVVKIKTVEYSHQNMQYTIPRGVLWHTYEVGRRVLVRTPENLHSFSALVTDLIEDISVETGGWHFTIELTESESKLNKINAIPPRMTPLTPINVNVEGLRKLGMNHTVTQSKLNAFLSYYNEAKTYIGKGYLLTTQTIGRFNSIIGELKYFVTLLHAVKTGPETQVGSLINSTNWMIFEMSKSLGLVHEYPIYTTKVRVTPSELARHTGMTVDQLYALNPGIRGHLIIQARTQIRTNRAVQ